MLPFATKVTMDENNSFNHEALDELHPMFALSDLKRLAVRVALVGEIKDISAIAWLQLVAPNQNVSVVSESYIGNFSSSRETYDALFAVGHDARRLQNLIRLYLPIWKGKPKIAVMIGNMPPDRSKLLMAGYDDVIDQRIPVPEAQAKLLAVYRRYSIAGNKAAKLQVPLADTSLWCDEPLNDREQEVLSTLIHRAPAKVPTYDLCKSPTGKKDLSPSSVKVIVSKIRAKLKPGFSITCVASSYALGTEPPATDDPQ